MPLEDAYNAYFNEDRESFVQRVKYMAAVDYMRSAATPLKGDTKVFRSDMEELAELCVDVSTIVGKKYSIDDIAFYFINEFIDFDYPTDYEVSYHKIDKFLESKTLDEWVAEYMAWQEEYEQRYG